MGTPVTSPRPQPLLERIWIASIAGAIMIFNCHLTAAIIAGGSGVRVEHGEFVLGRGLLVEEMHQGLGFVMYVLLRLLFIAAASTAALSIGVFLKHTTLRVPDVLREAGLPVRRHLRWLRFALATTALPLVALLLRLVS